MNSRVWAFWERLRSSFWFLPSVMTSGAAGLSFATVALDASVSDDWLNTFGLAYSGGAEGASAVLGAIAGSMISIAGLVFSMTLVALSLTSSQFGPRLLRNFMRDTVNQVVLGTFVATFVYCLLVLRTIRRGDETAFVPHLSVTLGVLMAIGSVAVLIYFIHHVATSIQADEVIARVAGELNAGIGRLYPTDLGSPPPVPPVAEPVDFERGARPLMADGDGYVQSVDADGLLGLAERHNLVVRIERRPGQYVIAGAPLVRVWPGERADDDLATRVRAAFVLGNFRTPTQDVEHSVNQLVEVAVRALSPGINDPFTAVACIDRLGSALARLGRAAVPSPFRHDQHGRLRVVARPATFDGIADAAFNQIRQYGRTSVAVTLRLLETIEVVAAEVLRPDDLATLLRHAEMVARAGPSLPEEADRHAVAERYESASRRLKQLGCGRISSVAADAAPGTLGEPK